MYIGFFLSTSYRFLEGVYWFFFRLLDHSYPFSEPFGKVFFCYWFIFYLYLYTSYSQVLEISSPFMLILVLFYDDVRVIFPI